MKELVVSLSIPFIGRLHFSEIRNIPSIGCEETKARISLAWDILFTGTSRTCICEKGLCEDSLPAAYTPFIGVRRGRKCLASGPREKSVYRNQ